MLDSEGSPLPPAEEVADDLVQINREVSPRSIISTGLGIAVGMGIMAVVGRLAVIYNPRITAWGYVLMILFVTPFLLSYTERVEALPGRGGLYGLVRQRYGITFSYLVGWLELAGHAAIIAILARVIAMYGITMYETLVGKVGLSISMLALGAVIVMVLFHVADIHGSRKLNATLAILGVAFMVIISVVSLMHIPGQLSELSNSLKSVAPFKLSTLLLGSFWGVILIFDMRHRVIKGVRRPVAWASWIIMIIVAVLGALVTIAIVPGVDNDSISGVLTTNTFSALVYKGDAIYTVLIALFSLLIALMGLSRALTASADVMSRMTEDGYFPPSFNYRVHRAVFPPLLFVSVLALALIFFVDSITIMGMAAAFLFAVTILVHVPDLTGSESYLPDQRPIRLPFHPLFPALTVVVATLATFNLPRDALKWSGLWFIVGVFLLVVYSFNRAIKSRAQLSIIVEERVEGDTKKRSGKEARPQGPLVMALVRNADSAPMMLRLGGRIAKNLKGALVIMQIAEVAEGIPEEEQQKHGAQLWRQLSQRVQELGGSVEGVTVKPMVRVAQDVILGAINASEELHPQYLLVAPDFIADDPDRNLKDYDKILRKSSSHVIFLNRFPRSGDFKHIAVLMDRGIQAPLTLSMANMLLAEGGVLEIVHVITPAELEDKEEHRREHILSVLENEGISEDEVTITFVQANAMEDAVEAIAKWVDLILLGANKNFMTQLPTFTGGNAYLFQNLDAPIILAAKHEKLRLGWLSNLWVFLTDPLPKLTLEDREEAARNIIAGADPTIDFFILILLSAGIATYGLLQNSGAVIIGAMLVAPLMSPIVAIAMSMIRGDVRYLGVAAQATAQGVLLAIAVGAALTFFSPIKAPTNEIMGRTHPNLLDLSIAFLSGAAGAYAMSRKSIASALPGVSIAVALVPPLAVVGYGFAVADLDIAFGALLLFFTNLIAIVLAASLVFIALDFLTTEKQTWGEIVRGLRVTAAFAIVVMMILGWVTYTTVTEQHKLTAIHQVLDQKLYAANFKPLDVKIERNRHGGYVIQGALLSYDRSLTAEQMKRLGEDLEKAVGGPVTLDITTIPAASEGVSFETAVTTTEIEEAVRSMIKELPVEEIVLTVEPNPERYKVVLAVMAFKPNALPAKKVDELEQALSEKYDKPVEINVYAIPTEKIDR